MVTPAQGDAIVLERVTPAKPPAASLVAAQIARREGSGVAEPVFNWRPTIERRVVVAAAIMGLWTLGIEARLVFLQVYSYDELTQRAERQ